jgi:polysaccharide pyruvyl transferase WcaK-like protein
MIHKENVPVIIFGTGVQPLDFSWPGQSDLTKANKELLRYNVDKAKLVSVRTPASKKTLISVGCNPDRIKVIGDPVLLASADRKKSKIAGRFRDKRPVVGVCPSMCFNINVLFGRNEAKVRGGFTEFIKYLIDKKFNVVVFPVLPEEITVHWEIVRKIRSKRLCRINNIIGLEQTMRLMRDCDIIVGQKLHTSVLATASGTPFVSVAYRPKCIEYAESVNCLDCVVRTDENLPKRMIEVFGYVWKKRKTITKRLVKERGKYRKRILAFAKETAKLIESYHRKKR